MTGLKLNSKGAIIGIVSSVGGGSFAITADRFTITGPFVLSGFTLKPDYGAKRSKDQAAPLWKRITG